MADCALQYQWIYEIVLISMAWCILLYKIKVRSFYLTSVAYPGEVRGRGSTPIESADFLNFVCKIYCPSFARILIKSLIFYRKTLKKQLHTNFTFCYSFWGTSFVLRPPTGTRLHLDGDGQNPWHGPHHVNPSIAKSCVAIGYAICLTSNLQKAFRE